MKWTDPTLKLIAAGSSNYAADWVGWNRTVLDHLKHHADFLSLHLYVGNKENNYADFVASPHELVDRTKVAEGIIRGALTDEPGRKIGIAWDEWNVWYRARGSNERGRRILEEQYNLEDALVVAGFLNGFINNAHIVKIANMAQLVNVIAPIFTSPDGMYLQTIYYPLQLFASNSFGNALELFVQSPTYASKYAAEAPYIDVSAAYDNGNLVLNVVNRHRTDPLPVVFELEDKRYGGAFQAFEVNGPDIKSQNDFKSSPVKVARRSVEASGNRLRCEFPAHSYTMLKGKLA
jgi:alpha-N-arabinofuranosidase